MLRAAGLVLLLVAASWAGCLSPKDDVEPAATNATPPPAPARNATPPVAEVVATPADAVLPGDPSFRDATRVFPVPNGSSYLVIPIHLTEADWFQESGTWWWTLFVAPSKGVSVSFARSYGIDGSDLTPRGAGLSFGGGGMTGWGQGARAPSVVDELLVVNLVAKGNASSLRVGAASAFDFQISKTEVPGRVLAQGESKLSYDYSAGLLDGDARAGVQTTDAGVAKGVGRVGAFQLTATHDVLAPSLHASFMWAWPTAGAGAWHVSQAIDGKSRASTQPLAWAYLEGSFPMAEGDGVVTRNVADALDDAQASALPDFVFLSATIPWSPASAGYSLEPSFRAGFLGAPVVLATPQGCQVLSSQGAQDAPSCAAFSP